MSGLNYVVLDVLKPHQPSILEMGQEILKLGEGISVNLRTAEIDERTESVQVIVKGKNIPLDRLKSMVEKMGGSIHSIDEVSLGKETINSMDYMRIRG